MIDHLIVDGARMILQGIGVDLTDPNFSTTPERMLKVYKEMFVPQETGWPVFDESYTDIVVMKEHTFYTMCPHHFLPVKLVASVAYIPKGKVIGASKLVRMMNEANKMPMTQEKLTADICEGMRQLTQGTSRGEAIKMVGEHGCMAIRGVRSDASMVTQLFRGEFAQSEEWRQRFNDLIR